MSDFLTRLAQRAVGAAPSIRPMVPPTFAPAVEPLIVEREHLEDLPPAGDPPLRTAMSAPSVTAAPGPPRHEPVVRPAGQTDRAGAVPPAPPRAASPREPAAARPVEPARSRERPIEPPKPWVQDVPVIRPAPELRAQPVAPDVTAAVGRPMPRAPEQSGEPVPQPAPRVSRPAPPVTVVAIPRPAEPPLAAPPRGDEGPALSAVGDRGLARHEAPAITRVTIGRIEVRMAPPRPPAAPPSRPAPTLSLQDYLTRPKEPAQ